jgi:hypothetical protein
MHISGHEVVTTNVFVPDHVIYHLTTVPLNIEVKRRFKDFETSRGDQETKILFGVLYLRPVDQR